MIVAASLVLLLHAASPAERQLPNQVVVCSPATGEGCQTYAAATLDPTALPSPQAAGQIAFVDPDSGELVTPTAEQLDAATDLVFSEEKAAIVPRQEKSLADGTVLVVFPEGYVTRLVVTVPETEQ